MKNWIGLKFGKLTVLEQKRENNRTYCYCKCECGNKLWIRADSLSSSRTISCGCYNKENNYVKAKNIKGMKSGRLTAIELTEKRDKQGCVIWKCECECGNIVYLAENIIINKKAKSCGCLAREKAGCNQEKAFNKFKEKYLIDDTNVNSITRKTLLKNNTSGVTGVTWNKSKKKWVAQIGFKGKNYILGSFRNKEDAINIRKQAEEKIFGEFLEWYQENIKGK